MKTQYTKGPWRMGAETENVVRIYPQNSAQAIAGAVGDNALNDARLIAAAPDLLAACEEAASFLTIWGHEPKNNYEKALKKMLDATIKKARGES